MPFVLSDEDHALLQDLLARERAERRNRRGANRSRGAVGTGFRPPERRQRRGGGENSSPVKILTATQDGSNYRWTYTGTPVRRTSAHTWEVIDSDNVVTLENAYEYENGSSGTVDGDVTLDTEVTGLESVPVDRIVRAWPEGGASDSNGGRVWVFWHRNTPTIECAE